MNIQLADILKRRGATEIDPTIVPLCPDCIPDGQVRNSGKIWRFRDGNLVGFMDPAAKQFWGCWY